ncbi:segregation and condensation protein ScpB [Bifidobacterium goeldii]|uniref:Segregation and condensation protein ScpB n=1 Tax=Bifidobacterium goeldii TaxID=2306975 RepID=A0A430FN15_9BIFI|nr:SMC-Scp complex subunit ScpB [Bifidobacterium goeldii]RSX54220.1 segregation and condensation protein ScpB [Bifidobacterium goeldii]
MSSQQTARAQALYDGIAVDAFPGGLRACLEAILMVADQPQQEADLARILHVNEQEVHDALATLRASYDDEHRGFELRHSARGWQYASRAAFEQVTAAFVTDGQSARLSQAALEALAVIAYKQPVTRAQIAAIRGVNSDGVIRSLMVRGLVREEGVDEESRAALLVTSAVFLEKMGLDSLDQLPSLAPFLPDSAGAVVAQAQQEASFDNAWESQE